MKEKTELYAEIHDVTGETLAQLIRYCYTLEIDINASNVEEILIFSHLFRLVDVVPMCESFLMNNLNSSNVVTSLAAAERYELIELGSVAREYIHRRFMNVIQQESFLDISVDQLANALNVINLRSNPKRAFLMQS